MNKDTTKSNRGQSTLMSVPMSPGDFTEWGVPYVAYIKPVVLEDSTAYAIFAANGQQLGIADTLDMARAVVVQNDLEPVNVH
jgi:hypothetical protein